MKITAIKQQVKTAGRYSIFVDEVFAFGLSDEGLLQSGITVGQEIDEGKLAQLKGTAKLDKAYGRCLGLLARRPRSEWEIRDYLKRKDYGEDEASTIVVRLESRGYLDDQDFARRWVEDRRLLKATSQRRLQQELRAKRVSDDIISQVLANDETDELEVLRELIIRKRTQSRYQDEQKLMAYLIRQGYNYGDVKRVLSEADDEII